MKKLSIITGVVFMILAAQLIYINTAPLPAQKKVESQEKLVLKKVISIEGMTCGGCEDMISQKALEIDGVISVKASSPKKQAIVEYDVSKTDIDTIMKEIRKTGYKPVSYSDINITTH